MALIDNLVSYWKLDEASGDAVDAHGTNTLTDTNTVGSATGMIGNARDFERDNNEYFTHTDNADLSAGDTDWTFACWIYGESLTTAHPIAHKGWDNASGNREWQFYYDQGGPQLVVAFETSGGSTNYCIRSGALSATTWYHVVCWHDSVNNLVGMSVNAGTATTTGHSGGIRDGTGPFQIGATSSQGLYWDGLIDEAGWWRRVLTSTERTDLYNGGVGLAYPFSAGAQDAPELRQGRYQMRQLLAQ